MVDPDQDNQRLQIQQHYTLIDNKQNNQHQKRLVLFPRG